jgi:beta-mannanase
VTQVRDLLQGCYYPTSNNVYNFNVVETQIGRRFDTYSTFISFDSQVSGHSEMLAASKAGHDVLVAWGPSRTVGLTFADILAGKFDAKIDEWLTYFATFPTRVTVRFAWEMNGSWMPWSPLYSQTAANSSHCTSTTQFRYVWWYVVNRSDEMAPNVDWMWCPNAADGPGLDSNKMERYYPGSSWVDIIGYDSYNSLNGKWMGAAATLAGHTNNIQLNAYTRVAKLHPTAPIWVGETGCVDANDPKDVNPTIYPGHSKADWVKSVFALDTTAAALPRLAAVNWFDTKGTRNWRFDSSPEALVAYQAG